MGQTAPVPAPDPENPAQDEVVTRSTRTEKERDYARPSGVGLDFYVGVDAGYGVMIATDESESNKSGLHLNPKGWLSAYTDRVALDLGGGFVRNELKGEGDERQDESGQTVVSDDVAITTSVGNLHAAGNVSLTTGFWLGMTGDMMIGTDASFSPHENRSTGDPASFLGAQIYWGGEWESLRVRAGLRYLTDVNIVERQMHIGMVSLAVGLPVIRRQTLVITSTRAEEQAVSRAATVEKTVPRYVPVPEVVVAFAETSINFVTASAELSAASRTMLIKVGRFLAENRGLWGRLIVEGHTDRRGSQAYNMDLSRRRARSVRQALIDGGAPADLIRAAGFGFSRPLVDDDSDLALARNRRVDLRFDEVKDEEALRAGIARARD